MDFSTEYQKMCAAAKEIQEIHKLQEHEVDFDEGDYVYVEYYGGDKCVELISSGEYSIGGIRGVYSSTTAGYCEGSGSNIISFIWLPRLDQLIDMMGDGGVGDGVYLLLRRKNDVGNIQHLFYTEIYKDDIMSGGMYGNSYEQTALMRVMQKNYGKTWNGEEWV